MDRTTIVNELNRIDATIEQLVKMGYESYIPMPFSLVETDASFNMARIWDRTIFGPGTKYRKYFEDPNDGFVIAWKDIDIGIVKLVILCEAETPEALELWKELNEYD